VRTVPQALRLIPAGAALLVAVAAAGCDEGSAKGGPLVLPDPGATAQRSVGAPGAGALAPAPVVRPPSLGAASPQKAAHGNAMEFVDKIAWRTWEEGKAEAAQQGKPIFLLVYADWCPKCRALAPVFADREIESLAERYVMVRQNADDDDATWLDSVLGAYGSYVPRIFFFQSNGTVRADVTSGHTKYPYFYSPEQGGLLKKKMSDALL
jgi:thiol:disulfide interchange protein